MSSQSIRPAEKFPATGKYGETVDELTAALQRARSGDPDGLRRFVTLSQPTIWRLCSYLVDPAVADDLCQDTYLRALRGLHRYRQDAPALIWLLAIARRVCADELRRRYRQAPPQKVTEPISPDVADQVTTSQLLHTLDPDQRSALVLTQLVGLSYAETASICDCPIGTIRSRVARARTELMRQLHPGSTDRQLASPDTRSDTGTN